MVAYFSFAGYADDDLVRIKVVSLQLVLLKEFASAEARLQSSDNDLRELLQLESLREESLGEANDERAFLLELLFHQRFDVRYGQIDDGGCLDGGEGFVPLPQYFSCITRIFPLV